MNLKWLKWILVGGALLAVPVLVGIYGVSIVRASSLPGVVGRIAGPAILAHPGFGNGTVDKQALLAEALGISVEELEAAQQAAFETSIAAAVEEGKITQEQADQILEGNGTFKRGFGMRGSGMHGLGHGGLGSGNNYNSLLAEELGIRAEELQEAHQSANETALEQLVVEGILTEEQAENARAAAALRAYLDRASLTAEALGISPEALEAAKENGKSLAEILEDQGTDRATYRENLAAATEAAIDQAVAEGVISQDQADQLQSGAPFGFGPGRGFGHGRGHGRSAPNAPQENTSVNTVNA
ncbi:MAG: hypothetical protein J4N76_03270 [Chloroflexi bacterium]|nr:hypothetical protein [Chloroflexota bacterium]MCI0828143.1 hypothetical protein [Chloroflexota bacterium]MCI0854642.1 hypothetical protein [Chloroflexota bacterium]MCI0860731.1 hypothetical protein [Chloroflexota bacterium]MCI0875567.1 hypothetical protein [Chloroflexota bacterium]